MIKKDTSTISLEIKKEDFESFCNAIGFFKKEFIELLESSERDHQQKRIKERKSLMEILSD
ncbi:MAG: hypothetical protein AB1630_02710 [bacterium]